VYISIKESKPETYSSYYLQFLTISSEIMKTYSMYKTVFTVLCEMVLTAIDLRWCCKWVGLNIIIIQFSYRQYYIIYW
jgi:hypothetical protein